MADILLEGLYVLSGLVSLVTAVSAWMDPEHPTRVGTTVFWGFLAGIFIFGRWLPSVVVGAMLVVMGVLTALRQVKFGTLVGATDEFREKAARRLGNLLFVPALSIAVFAFGIAQFTTLGGLVGLGIGAVVATVLALLLTKAGSGMAAQDGSRLLQQIGAASILPQLLTALGALFSAAGVGDVIARGISRVIPAESVVFGVIAYAVGMALFTIIMGNAFAAFAVITAGIGVPFVLEHGANPAIIGSLALTAGYCGTLMTPMAANFNVVPAAVLEMKDKNGVIKAQVPIALLLLAIHIILMVVMGF